MARLASRLLSGFLLALSVQFPSHSAERTQLVVYSTLEADFLAELKKAFEANNPDLSILWQKDSTGVTTARILAERGQRGDAIWGLAATSMMRLKKDDLLAPHTPPNLPEIKSNFRDPDDPPRWIGMQAWAAAVCFNTVEAARLGLQSLPPGTIPRVPFSGSDHHAGPQLVRNGLLPRLRLDPAVRGGGGVALHGSAPCEYRELRALGDEALPERRDRRVRGRDLL